MRTGKFQTNMETKLKAVSVIKLLCRQNEKVGRNTKELVKAKPKEFRVEG